MGVRNFKHGRLYLESGDTPTALSRVMTFSGGTFEFTEGRNRNEVRDRGELVEITPGDSVGVTWSFERRYEDRFSILAVRDGLFNGQAETVTGLVAGALNANVALSYDYQQGSLQIAAGDPLFPGAKLATAGVPAADGEFSENTGAANVEQVITVAQASAFNIFMPVGDTDIDLVYDAVGQPTSQGASADGCEGAVNYFNLRFDVYDPCNPPSVLNPAQGIVEERFIIRNAYLNEDSFAEDEEANTITFSGSALAEKVEITPVP